MFILVLVILKVTILVYSFSFSFHFIFKGPKLPLKFKDQIEPKLNIQELKWTKSKVERLKLYLNHIIINVDYRTINSPKDEIQQTKSNPSWNQR